MSALSVIDIFLVNKLFLLLLIVKMGGSHSPFIVTPATCQIKQTLRPCRAFLVRIANERAVLLALSFAILGYFYPLLCFYQPSRFFLIIRKVATPTATIIDTTKAMINPTFTGFLAFMISNS